MCYEAGYSDNISMPNVHKTGTGFGERMLALYIEGSQSISNKEKYFKGIKSYLILKKDLMTYLRMSYEEYHNRTRKKVSGCDYNKLYAENVELVRSIKTDVIILHYTTSQRNNGTQLYLNLASSNDVSEFKKYLWPILIPNQHKQPQLKFTKFILTKINNNRIYMKPEYQKKYSDTELINILKRELAVSSRKVEVSLHKFIITMHYFIDNVNKLYEIMDKAGMGSYKNYSNELYSICRELTKEDVIFDFTKLKTTSELTETGVLKTYFQQVYYGAPGTGKSHEIQRIIKENKAQDVIRTTFHPDSDYSTFVGTYKPMPINRITQKCHQYLTADQLKDLYNNFISQIPKPTRPEISFAGMYYFQLEQLGSSSWPYIFIGSATSVVTYEVPKGIAAGKMLAAKLENEGETISYSFTKQAFTKAYLLAWKKYTAATSSFSSKTISSIIGLPNSPYSTTLFSGNRNSFACSGNYNIIKGTDIEDILSHIDIFEFPFDGYNTLGDLHNDTEVIIADKPTVDQLDKLKRTKRYSKQKLESEIKRIKDLFRSEDKSLNYMILQGYHAHLAKILEWGKSNTPNGEEEFDYTEEFTDSSLLGLCVKESGGTKIYLFADNLGTNKELWADVYVHEMFHAYFKTQNIAPELEEPIVECCALCLLESFENATKKQYSGLYSNNQKVVEDKKSGSMGYYGFGAFLFANRSLDWMKLFQKGWASIDFNSQLYKDYIESFTYYPFGNEQGVMDMLYSLLVIDSKSKEISANNAQFLIIEEINRGNCAQIFGDLFQLLDRQDNGFSEYPIEADTDMQKAIKKAFAEEPDYKLSQDINVDGVVKNYKSTFGHTLSEDIQEGRVLLLPNNLFIWATMNTSDQSLFPMDSAFKRRWDWAYMPINTRKENWAIDVNDTLYSWTSFLDIINEKIYDKTDSEDKQLGFYFCKADKDNNIIPANRFVNKVLFYIYNDVFKDQGLDDNIFIGENNDKLSFRKYYKYNDNPEDNIDEERVALFLDNLGVEEYRNETTPINKQSYSLDGKTFKVMSKFGQAVIEKFLEEQGTNMNFSEIESTLKSDWLEDIPQNVVVIKETEKDKLKSYIRYYKASPITSSDGIKFLVYKQWGNPTIQHVLNFAKEQGYNVEVKDL